MTDTLTTLGELVTLSKSVFDAAKALKGLFVYEGHASPPAELEFRNLVGAVRKMGSRLRSLAAEIEKVEELTRVVPGFIESCKRISSEAIKNAVGTDVQKIANELLLVVAAGQAIFVRHTSLAADVQRNLRHLQATLDNGPSTKPRVFRDRADVIAQQLNDVRSAAGDLLPEAQSLHGRLIKELIDAALISETVGT